MSAAMTSATTTKLRFFPLLLGDTGVLDIEYSAAFIESGSSLPRARVGPSG
jgi:hypothetical protein